MFTHLARSWWRCQQCMLYVCVCACDCVHVCACMCVCVCVHTCCVCRQRLQAFCGVPGEPRAGAHSVTGLLPGGVGGEGTTDERYLATTHHLITNISPGIILYHFLFFFLFFSWVPISLAMLSRSQSRWPDGKSIDFSRILVAATRLLPECSARCSRGQHQGV